MKPVSVSKMNLKELEDYTQQIKTFAAGNEVARIRICECCILIAST